jgi:hypothetical protein
LKRKNIARISFVDILYIILRMPDILTLKGGTVERLFFFGGIASTVGGVSVIFYQGIIFLKDGVWNPYSVLSIIDTGPGSLAQGLVANQTVMDALQKCPLSAALIALGAILLLAAGRLRNRYA